jgi:hypothetical protein
MEGQTLEQPRSLQPLLIFRAALMLTPSAALQYPANKDALKVTWFHRMLTQEPKS